MNENIIVGLVAFLVVLSILIAVKPGQKPTVDVHPIPYQYPPSQPRTPDRPATPNLSVVIPNYLRYEQMQAQLTKWRDEAPALTEHGVIGESSRKTLIDYIRITNLYIPETQKSKVLVTACIHGNEPHATATVMAYIGTLLAGYGKDPQITNLLDTRDIYFVPILSPDSYPDSRHVDGVDPNRDYDDRRSAPVRAIQTFFQKHKFKAALSGHTWGRVYLIPPGNSMTNTTDHEKYKSVIGEMATASRYRWMRACDMYKSGGGLANPPVRWGEDDWSVQKANVPIYGTEVDWYYSQGAFAIVMEFGTHQRLPSPSEIKEEFQMTWKAFLIFLEKAPIAL